MAKGQMKKTAEGHLMGQICTRSMNEKFQLVPNTERRGDKPPSHIVIAKAPAGHTYEAGMAWEYSIGQGAQAGRTGFNILFNDPDFGPEGIWISAYPNDLMGWDLSLAKKEQTQQQAA